MEPLIAQKHSFKVEEKAGTKRAWCACGKSANQPYCDGSHKDTGFTPVIVTIEKDERVAWCGCKHSKNKPYCDGTHRDL